MISLEHQTTVIKMKNHTMKAEATLTKRGLVYQCRNCAYLATGTRWRAM